MREASILSGSEMREAEEQLDVSVMVSAIEALRRGQVDRALLWMEPRSRTEPWGRLFQRIVAPLDPSAPASSGVAAPELLPSDRTRARASSDWPYRYVLAFHERLAERFYLDDLLPPLWRIYVGASLAGRECVISGSPQKQRVLLAIDYADSVLDWIELLGGDARAGLLSIVSGRELDDDGEFGRALSFAHACGIWALAIREAEARRSTAEKKKSAESLAAFAPMLVLARFTLRMRAQWQDAPAWDEARRRLAAWDLVPESTIAETYRRVALAADEMASWERAAPAAASGELTPGRVVLTPESGVTAVLSVSPLEIGVAGLGQPKTPVRALAPGDVIPVAFASEVGPATLTLPNLAALEAERERLLSEDWSKSIWG